MPKGWKRQRLSHPGDGRGALGQIGGSLMGPALGAIFGDDGSGQCHEELLEQFKQQRLMLNRLDNQIVALQGSINSLKADIAKLGQAMVEQFGLAAYNSKVDALLAPIGTIDGLYLSYMDEIQRRDGSEDGKARVEALANEIRARVPSALTTLHLALLGRRRRSSPTSPPTPRAGALPSWATPASTSPPWESTT